MKQDDQAGLSQSGEAKPQEKRSREARERILEEAKKLFREKGFEGVSLNEIVAAVGIKKPTIYYYFGDKEGLFAEVLKAMLRHGHDIVSANVRAGLSTAEKLEKLAEGYLRFCPTSLMSMIRDALVCLGPANQQAVLEAYRFYLLTPFERIFEEGAQNGEIKPIAPRELAIMYLGLIDTVTTQKTLLEGRGFDHKASSELLMELMFQGIKA
jgi:TetR/AcrR family transcriptional regulator